MTVIAIKDGVLACDSGVFSLDGAYRGSVAKALIMDDGYVIGMAGPCGAFAALLAAAGGAGFAGYELPEDTSVLMLTPDGEVRQMDGPHMGWAVIDAPFHAIGSGAHIAIGAMAAGASAERAVEIACEWAEGCRGPVRIFKAGERP